jgi:ADP-ribose pyrophosphatase
MFEGPLFKVVRDRVTEPSGQTVFRDVVQHRGSVVIAVKTGREPSVLLEKQYRHAIREFMWELPAGGIDAGETSRETAIRELIEETGFRATKWHKALEFYVSPGFVNEHMTLFLAHRLKPGRTQLEPDESISTHFFPLRKCLEMIQSGAIRDAKSIVGIYWLALHRKVLKS